MKKYIKGKMWLVTKFYLKTDCILKEHFTLQIYIYVISKIRQIYLGRYVVIRFKWVNKTHLSERFWDSHLTYVCILLLRRMERCRLLRSTFDESMAPKVQPAPSQDCMTLYSLLLLFKAFFIGVPQFYYRVRYTAITQNILVNWIEVLSLGSKLFKTSARISDCVVKCNHNLGVFSAS